MNIHSPRAQQQMQELKTYQRSQVDRLAQPKRNSMAASVNQLDQVRRSSHANSRADSSPTTTSCTNNFLRKTSQAAVGSSGMPPPPMKMKMMNRSPSLGSPKRTGAIKQLQVMGGAGASLKDHLAAQISSQPHMMPELKQSSRNQLRETVGSQGLNLTARSSNRANNNLLIDQIASARQSMKEDAAAQHQKTMDGAETPIL